MANRGTDGSVERDARSGRSQSFGVGAGRKAFGMCLNWRVLVALALVGLVVLVAAPGLAARALPLLFVAVCPLSMAAMMWGMRGTKAAPARPVGAPEPTVASAEPELGPEPTLSDLHSQLAGLHAQQERLTRRIAELETAGRRDEPAPAPGPGIPKAHAG